MAKLYIDRKWTTTLKRKADRKAAAEAVTSSATTFCPPLIAATTSPLSRKSMAIATAVFSGTTPSASFPFSATVEIAPTLQMTGHTSAIPSPLVTTFSAIIFPIGTSSAPTLPNITVTLQDSKDKINGDIQLLGRLYKGLETDYFKLTGRFTTNISPTHTNVAIFKKSKYQDSDFLFDLQDEIADSSAAAAKRTALWNKEDVKGKGIDQLGARERLIAAESHKVKTLIARYLKVRNDLKQLRETLENMNKGASGVCRYDPLPEWKVIGIVDTILSQDELAVKDEVLKCGLDVLLAGPVIEETATIPTFNDLKVKTTKSKLSAIDSPAPKHRFVPPRTKKSRPNSPKSESPVKKSKISKKKVLPKNTQVANRVTRSRLRIIHKPFTVDDGPYENSSIDPTTPVAHSSYLQNVVDPGLSNQELWKTKYTKLEVPEHLKHLQG